MHKYVITSRSYVVPCQYYHFTDALLLRLLLLPLVATSTSTISYGQAAKLYAPLSAPTANRVRLGRDSIPFRNSDSSDFPGTCA